MYSIATGAQEIRQTSAQQESSATYDLVRSDKLNQHFWTLENCKKLISIEHNVSYLNFLF